eukprot:TRINITY_DN13750_c0_g2_i3.p1 TRINITY_DN13750_c0_g2~~TRINITY_DN13750_c0_g2_i3.p1  ORF type:complete len:209 (-),score=-23.21 TRINITY_DN13750_c0_g2_i3:136-762(-)
MTQYPQIVYPNWYQYLNIRHYIPIQFGIYFTRYTRYSQKFSLQQTLTNILKNQHPRESHSTKMRHTAYLIQKMAKELQRNLVRLLQMCLCFQKQILIQQLKVINMVYSTVKKQRRTIITAQLLHTQLTCLVVVLIWYYGTLLPFQNVCKTCTSAVLVTRHNMRYFFHIIIKSAIHLSRRNSLNIRTTTYSCYVSILGNKTRPQTKVKK